MYGNVGLPTPRGSGTNGYVVRNLSYIRQRKDVVPYESLEESKSKASSLLNRQPNQEILNHEKKRKVEIECLNYRRKLEEVGKREEEIEERVNIYRQELLSSLDTMRDDKNIQEHQVHQLSQAKATENERMMKALGIKPHEYVEGAAFDRDLQEQNKRDRLAQKAKQNEERQKRIIEKNIELLKKKDDKKQDVRDRNKYSSVKREEKKDHGRDYKDGRKSKKHDTESNSESSSESSSDSSEGDDSDNEAVRHAKNYESKGRSNRYEDRDADVIHKGNNESRNIRDEDYRRTDRRLPRSPRRRHNSSSRRHRDASIPTSRRYRDGSLSPVPSRHRESASPHSRRNRDYSFSPPRRRQRNYSPKDDYNSRRTSHKRSPSLPSSHRRHHSDNVRSEDRISQRRTEELNEIPRRRRNRSSDLGSSSEDERKSSVYKRKRRDDTSDSELDDRRDRRPRRHRDTIGSNSSDSSIPKEETKHPQLSLPEHLQRKRRRGRESDSSTYSSQNEN
ncbi:8099_t:CDS:2 [Acaulospora morrowiae]|uniref:8099_t:CDS:1 n=1 Tax=Acaulospora morrowiae TaxID=94023 RepID=A0A9N9EVT9_9GLOM|nr:8099_t:CDS:2 [Acaulospora morrowiae]